MSQTARRAEWIDLLGAQRAPDAEWRTTERSADAAFRRFTIELVSYGSRLTARLVLPLTADPSPVVVLPFYDTEVLFGEVSPLYPDPTAHPTRAFARAFLDAGMGVLAVPWWAEAAARQNASPLELHERYGPVAETHLAQHPQVTGLGRSVADLLVAVDALDTIEEVDSIRIGTFGHSLGGKLSLFAAALDPRIAAAVTHEPGLGFAHSNWSDPWYLGDRIPDDRDLDQVLGLIAPRPVLYAGGGASDGAHNHALAASASGPDSRIEILHHMNGHPLPEDVLETMIRWLHDRLTVSQRQD